jgi:transmembrane sensor
MLDEERKVQLLTENSSVMNIIRLGLTRKLFQKYLSNQANAKEQETVESWDAEAYWNKYLKKTPDSELEKGCNEVWEKVSNQIHAEDLLVEYGQYPAIEPTTPMARTLLPHVIRKYVAVAAMFLLIAGATLFFITLQRNPNTFTAQQALAKIYFQTETSNLKIVKLSDGSIITLNSGTKLSMVENQFNRKQREVWLEGEAFFEVARNPEKPFIIHTGSMTTTVRGTSFNVKAYPQLAENVVSVRSGRVEVTTGKEQLALLTANKQLKYSTARHISESSEVNWKDAAGWIEGNLVLNGAGAEELKMRLQQRFGVTIIISGNALNGKSLSGSFSKERTLREIMSTISTVYSIHYKIKDNQVTITP